MIKCISCGHANLPGSDVCEECHQPLVQQALQSAPTSKLKKMIMTESIWNAIDQRIQPILLKQEDTVERAIGAFQTHKQSCLLIVDKAGKLVGILTYRDMANKVAGKIKDFKRTPISKIMTARPEALRKEDSVAFAINRMSVAGVRHIPIVSGDQKPIGWISVKAVLRHLSKKGLATISPGSSEY